MMIFTGHYLILKMKVKSEKKQLLSATPAGTEFVIPDLLKYVAGWLIHCGPFSINTTKQ